MTDNEVNELQEIKRLAKTDINDAIKRCEVICFKYLDNPTYKNGMVNISGMVSRVGTFPLLLVDLYYKAKDMSKCWNLINKILSKDSTLTEKLRNYQSKIRNYEKSPLEALQFKMMSLLHNNSLSYSPDNERVQKALKSLIKKAHLENRTDEIISVVIDNLSTKNGELSIRKYINTL